MRNAPHPTNFVARFVGILPKVAHVAHVSPKLEGKRAVISASSGPVAIIIRLDGHLSPLFARGCGRWRVPGIAHSVGGPY